MAEPFIGEIRVFGFDFPPIGWAACDGQLLPISQNTALFSLIGTTYGGDGKSSFALPDLRDRAPMQFGDGPGLTRRVLGERGGVTDVTLTHDELPRHNHMMGVAGLPGRIDSPEGNVIAQGGPTMAFTTAQPNAVMAPQALAATEGGQPHNNMQPFLSVNYCIALRGLFPPRP